MHKNLVSAVIFPQFYFLFPSITAKLTVIKVFTFNAIFVCLNISLDQLMLLHKILNGSEIFPGILARQKTFDFAQPKVKILDGRYVRALLVGLLQLDGFLGGLLGEELPLVGDGDESFADRFFRTGTLTLLNQVLAVSEHRLDPVGVRRQLGLERLMFLVFRLNIRRIL